MVYNWDILNDERKIRKDKINYILSYLHVGQYTNKRTNDRWVNINQETLINVLNKSGVDVLKDLIKGGYIECDGIYKKGVKSFGYRINYNKVPKKGIKVYDNKYYTKTLELIKTGQRNKLDYKTNAIIEFTKMFFNNGDIKFDNIKDVNKILNRWRSENYDRYYSQKILVDKIISGDITTVADKQGARIYSNYSNLSKDIRKHLTINGEKKICIDISNSQFQTLCLTINTMNPEIKSKFFNLVFDGQIYEYLMSKSGLKREVVKKDMLNWLYAENIVCKNKKDIGYIETIMKEDFKEIYDWIYDIKGRKDGGSKLAKQMQMKESSIIKYIQYELLLQGVTVISLHDSFYLQESISKDIIDYIKDQLIKSGYTAINEERESNEEVKEIKKKEINLGKRKGEEILDNYTHMMDKNKELEIDFIQKKKSDDLLTSKMVNLDELFNEIASEFIN